MKANPRAKKKRPVATIATGQNLDTLSRPMRDLRISVTDRCNLRCTYCMPAGVFDNGHCFLPHDRILSYEQIDRLTRCFVRLGVRKVRITGGEPLLRRDLPHLIETLRQINGVEDIALTTNGILLPQLAFHLRAAGLDRLTVSLDSLDDVTFKSINGRGVSVTAVLDGIEAAKQAGFDSIKLNMVVQRGVNDREVVDIARHFKGSGHTLRFIEFMDVGASNAWKLDKVVPSKEIIERLSNFFQLRPLAPNHRGEVASRYTYTDDDGELGFISSVSAPFCGDCNRVRLSATGEMFTCLFSSQGHDLRPLLETDAHDAAIEQHIRTIWTNRQDQYSQTRNTPTRDTLQNRVEMSYIGG